jgi:acyl-CoA synthetase (AMP-forming)/AMP-acid ligase II
MSPPLFRLQALTTHFLPSASPTATDATKYTHTHHIHTLSPTSFLPRAAEIEPDAEAIVHITSNGAILRRTYTEFGDRSRGLAYFLLKHGFKRIGILAPNTPAFLESIFGIAAAGAVNVAVNYRLKTEDISYIFTFSEVDVIIVDQEYLHLLDDFRKQRPGVPFIIDTDTDATSGELSGPFDEAVLEGLRWDGENGAKGWKGLKAQADDEDDMIAIPFTSGTTAKPKGVVYTHRGAYLAALGNVIESGLNFHTGRCGYLWTLPMFHAMGWSK